MSRKSTIKKLDPQLRAEIDRLLGEGRFTIQEVTDHVRKLGADVSRSAVYRYSVTYESLARDIRQAREVAKAISLDLADVTGDTGRLVIDSLQALLLRARTELTDDDKLDTREVARLAQAARDLQTAFKSTIDTEITIRKKVAKEIERNSESLGISPETIEAIKVQVLGMSPRKESSS
jgi:hypothetical protein